MELSEGWTIAAQILWALAAVAIVVATRWVGIPRCHACERQEPAKDQWEPLGWRHVRCLFCGATYDRVGRRYRLAGEKGWCKPGSRRTPIEVKVTPTEWNPTR